MLQISEFLERFKKVIGETTLSKSVLVEIIEQHLKLTIPKDSIKLKDAILYIKTTPIAKMELLLHKDEIINEIRNRLGKNIRDIK